MPLAEHVYGSLLGPSTKPASSKAFSWDWGMLVSNGCTLIIWREYTQKSLHFLAELWPLYNLMLQPMFLGINNQGAVFQFMPLKSSNSCVRKITYCKVKLLFTHRQSLPAGKIFFNELQNESFLSSFHHPPHLLLISLLSTTRPNTTIKHKNWQFGYWSLNKLLFLWSVHYR